MGVFANPHLLAFPSVSVVSNAGFTPRHVELSACFNDFEDSLDL